MRKPPVHLMFQCARCGHVMPVRVRLAMKGLDWYFIWNCAAPGCRNKANLDPHYFGGFPLPAGPATTKKISAIKKRGGKDQG